jgi:hypothetical protein
MIEVLLVAPLLAQSIDPFVFGTEFCWLKRQGLSDHQAIDRAVDKSWRPLRNAGLREIDIAVAIDLVQKTCET